MGAALDDLAVIDGGADQALVQIGDAENGTGAAIRVRPLKVAQVPAFARAVRPLMDEVGALMAGGLTAEAVLNLLENSTDKVIDALQAATGAPREALMDSTVAQLGDLLVAVLAANRDFLRGRLTAAIRTAAVISGAGPTPSTP